MAYIPLIKNVRSINTELEKIKGAGLTPVTLKSPGDISRGVIQQSGTSVEGLIIGFTKLNNDRISRGETPLSRNEYNQMVNDLVESVGDALTYSGAVDYSYNVGMKRMETYCERTNNYEFLEFLKSLSKEEFIKYLEEVGNTVNYEEQNGYNSNDSFIINTSKYMYEQYGKNIDDIIFPF